MLSLSSSHLPLVISALGNPDELTPAVFVLYLVYFIKCGVKVSLRLRTYLSGRVRAEHAQGPGFSAQHREVSGWGLICIVTYQNFTPFQE